MRLLGLNHGEYNSSACLLNNSILEAAVPEERFTRDKKTKKFPRNALNYILSISGLSLADFNGIAQGWNPGAKWNSFNPLLSTDRRMREEYFYSIPDNLYNYTERIPPPFVKMEFDNKIPPIWFINHHKCHAANAFYLSPYDEAAILTADWRGELQSITQSIGKGEDLTEIASQSVPNSLGMFYATYTQMLGFRPNNDEWKVMALSAIDVDYKDCYKRMSSTIKLLPGGNIELDPKLYLGAQLDSPRLYSNNLLMTLGLETHEGLIRDFESQCIAAKSMQRLAEEMTWHILRHLHSITNQKNLALSGGFFMNCVLNGKILENTPFSNLYVSHSPDDVGNSIGAALYLDHSIMGHPRVSQNNRSDLGPAYSSEQILEALLRRRVKYELCENPEDVVAKLLASGEIVAVLQGRMEFGDRALGFRSILADPRDPYTKDKINSAIKFREGFRPFAPVCNEEYVSEIFECDPGYTCLYMEKVVKIRESWRARIPAVCHYDNSARLQTVSPDSNNYLYQVIERFYSITEIPVLVNTSFNINGEPIVMDPDDALNTFFNSGLNYLMLDSYLITKN